MTTTQNASLTTYLILGGARSGKSGYAEKIAAAAAAEVDEMPKKEVIYIATATAFDSEMQARIKRHQSDRPKHWTSIEEPLYLTEALDKNTSKESIILVDCLTLWLNNLLMQDDSALLQNELEKFFNSLSTLQGTVIFVSNEVGLGVIPMGQLSRQFVDESGRLHQQLAQRVDHVMLMVAGIAMPVKGSKPF